MMWVRVKLRNGYRSMASVDYGNQIKLRTEWILWRILKNFQCHCKANTLKQYQTRNSFIILATLGYLLQVLWRFRMLFYRGCFPYFLEWPTPEYSLPPLSLSISPLSLHRIKRRRDRQSFAYAGAGAPSPFLPEQTQSLTQSLTLFIEYII